MKKSTICLLLVILIFTVSGCSGKESLTEGASSITEDIQNATEDIEELAENLENATEEFSELVELVEDSEKDAEEAANNDLSPCGRPFTFGDTKYNIIGVDLVEEDGRDILIVNLEVFNDSSEVMNYSSMMSMEARDSKGNLAVVDAGYTMFSDDDLNGEIIPGNKIIGKVAFDLSDTETEEYILQVGDFMNKVDAFKIEKNDIGQSFDEVFENQGVKAEYSLGDTIEFDEITVDFDGVRVEPVTTYNSGYSEPGMGLLVLDMTLTNNSDADVSFTSVDSWSTISGVYTSDGEALEYESYSYTNRNPVSPGETRTETFGLYFNEKDTDFYLTLNPVLFDNENTKLVSFGIDGGQVSDVEEDSVEVDETDDKSFISYFSTKEQKSMVVKSEIVSFGMKTEMTNYYGDNGDTRTETFIEGIGNNILIFLKDEEVMYSYVEDSGVGLKIINADAESSAESGFMIDYNSDMSELINGAGEDIIATDETYEGQEVVYIEATQADSDMGEALVKMWYSKEYETPIRYEVFINGTAMVEMKVIEIEDDVKIDDKMFEPDGAIEYDEVDMSNF